MESINIQQRLLDNLDILDKSVAKTALLLFSTSLIYLALYYGLSDTFRIPLIDIELKKEYPYHIGIPIIFFLFQYTLVTSMVYRSGLFGIGDELDFFVLGDYFGNDKERSRTHG